MSDEVLHTYLSRTLEAWQNLFLLPDKLPMRLGFFALLLGILLLFRGRRSWSWRASVGVVATLVLFHLNFLAMPFVNLVTDGLRAWYDGLGLWRVPTSVWSGAPVWVPALVGAVGHDFANYWNHRLMHQRWLWPVHAIHHSDPDLNPLTTLRVHALESFVMVTSYVLLLTWLGIPAESLGILGALLVLHNMYVHTDLDWHHGPFEILIASPRFHKWHHADVPEAHGKNLCNVIPFFDWVFGTYYCPGRCDAPIGAEGVPEHNPFKLFLFPLVGWAREVRKGVAWVAQALGVRDSDRPESPEPSSLG